MNINFIVQFLFKYLLCTFFIIDLVLRVKAETVPNSLGDRPPVTFKANDNENQYKYFLSLQYSPIDLILPNKVGLTLGMIFDQNKTWEIEYLQSRVSTPFVITDLGSMTDTRWSLLRRSPIGHSSFNIIYGVSYFSFQVLLGSEWMHRFSNGNYPSRELLDIQSFGFNAGFGNRWIWKQKYIIGIDWISWHQSLVLKNKNSDLLDSITDQNNKELMEQTMEKIAYFPRLVLFKIQIGLLF